MKSLDLNGVKIYDDENNTVEALNLIGQFGYFSNSKDFENYRESILAGVDCSYKQIWEPSSEYCVRVKVVQNNPFPYLAMLANAQQAESGDVDHYKYFVLKKDVKLQLRPFKTISEFYKEVGCEVGDVVTIKAVDGHFEETCVFTGFRTTETNQTTVHLGLLSYTFKELKEDYLYLKNGEWLPFGVEE